MSNLIRNALLFVLIVSSAICAQTRYTASWASVDKHNAAPEWFKDAKFGIYFHWGVFCVPAFGDEWYPRWMYNKGNNDYNHHLATFGDPYTNWPYHNFINGANDKNGKFTQFAPKLKSDGGKFDPEEWVNLFDSAGAKFAGPVAEHHDGFSMWKSTVNEWNSVDKGPKLDLASLFATAIRAKGMKFMMSMHHAYHFTGFFEYVPAQSDPSLKKLYGQLGSDQENQLWYDKLKEVIDGYQPDLIWQDFNLPRVNETQRLNFLSYYYNKGIDWGKEVVATYKDGFNNKGEVYDYERGGPADLTNPYWLTDDAISSSSWCYTVGIGYYSTAQMLHALIDRVSKSGNMLLNISPMADGTIPQQQRTVLLGIGDWLRRFGESIYCTRAWNIYGQGPTKMGGGAFTGPKTGTNKDFRFTRTKDSTTMYAICLGWPGNGASVKIDSITSTRFAVTGVYLFDSTAGNYIKINNFTQNNSGLAFTMPSTQPYSALAYAFKLTSARSTAINHVKNVSDLMSSPVPGEIYYGPLSWGSIKARKGIAGIEIFSLQGKMIQRCMFDNTRRGEDLKGLRRTTSSQAYYVKYLNKPEPKK
jgi:alpha-L-fucosidase